MVVCIAHAAVFIKIKGKSFYNTITFVKKTRKTLRNDRALNIIFLSVFFSISLWEESIPSLSDVYLWCCLSCLNLTIHSINLLSEWKRLEESEEWVSEVRCCSLKSQPQFSKQIYFIKEKKTFESCWVHPKLFFLYIFSFSYLTGRSTKNVYGLRGTNKNLLLVCKYSMGSWKN